MCLLQAGNVDACRLLANLGAVLEAKDVNSKTALIVAAANGLCVCVCVTLGYSKGGGIQM